MSSTGLDRVRRQYRLRSFRIASVLRIGVVMLMLGAMLVGTARTDWFNQSVLLALYAFTAIWALVLAFSPAAAADATGLRGH
ncbi:MAG TPA: hypothetical protein VMU34_27260 [Mycobacterium sp.]|nr:hypothetical protein [Mycobacterium sp.]